MSAAPQVVVVVGASSGIGRATARAFAEDGCDVVLAARSTGSLAEAAEECRAAGGRAVAVTADVTRDQDVEAVLEQAIDAFGHVDVWVNAAAVMVYGRFDEVPGEVHRRVVDTNLTGAINCARTALRHFKVRDRGVLITVGSLYGRMTSPYVSAYVTSKFGLIGFNEVLRQELADHPDIATCLILPGSVDTPIFRHTANFTGRGVQPVPPVNDPRRVVRAIVRCARRPRRQVVVGQVARLMAWSHALFPRVYDRLAPAAMDLAGLTGDGVPHTNGNVFEPMPEWNRVEGEWPRIPRSWSAALVGGGLTAAAGLGALRMRRR